MQIIIQNLLLILNVMLYDTTKMPRLNLCTMTVEKATECDAEAVFIVSNPKIINYHYLALSIILYESIAHELEINYLEMNN